MADTEIVTIRVSSKTKRLMLKSKLNWSKRLREYIEASIRSAELGEVIKKIRPVKLKGVTKFDSTAFIREDRDSR